MAQNSACLRLVNGYRKTRTRNWSGFTLSRQQQLTQSINQSINQSHLIQEH